MIDTIYATKKGMSQAWDASGKRLAITKFLVEPNIVVGEKTARIRTDKKDVDGWKEVRVVEIGYGAKKRANMAKPMRARLEKLEIAQGVRRINGVRETGEDKLEVGKNVKIDEIIKVGDIVAVHGTTKGRGFAGGVKRYSFHGGPKTHGQADRWRAVGSVGNRTVPGRVWLGKRLPGHMGMTAKTVTGLVVAHFDAETGELWLTGPVPGAFGGVVAIEVTGKAKKDFALDKKASGIVEKQANNQENQEDAAPMAASEVKEADSPTPADASADEKIEETK